MFQKNKHYIYRDQNNDVKLQKKKTIFFSILKKRNAINERKILNKLGEKTRETTE